MMEINIVKGAGEGCTAKSAFDSALLDAGIHNYNIIGLSSVIPKGTKIIELDKIEDEKKEEFGDKLYVVMSKNISHKTNEHIFAGIGWVQYYGGKGLFVEQKGSSYEEVEVNIMHSLREMIKRRDFPVEKIKWKIHGKRVLGKPTCVMVVAVYENEGWKTK